MVLLVSICFGAGLIGALAGAGGGMVVVPALTILVGVERR